MNRPVAVLLVQGLLVGVFVLCSLLPVMAFAQSKPVVVVSVPALGLIARHIGGADVEVHQLLQGDASPHDYAMKFSDRKALAQAQRVFWIAPALESFLTRPLTSLRQAVVLFPALPESEAHIWFAPSLVRESARVMAQHFTQLQPSAAAGFAARLATFESQVVDAEQKLSTQMQALRNVQLVVGHNAYGQLTRSHELPPALAVLQQVQTAASAQRLAKLEQRVAAGGNFCVVEERNHPLPVARQLAQRHKLPVVVIDVYAASATSYPDWLDQLGHALSGCAVAAASGVTSDAR